MKSTVLDRQSLFDIAVQESGSASAAFDLALENDLSLTDNLEVGEPVASVETQNKPVSDYYNNRQLKPATGITEEQERIGGINFMGIEIDFIVS